MSVCLLCCFEFECESQGPPQPLAPGHRACLANIRKVNELVMALPFPLPPKGVFQAGPSGDRRSGFLSLSPLYFPLLEVRPAISISTQQARQAPAGGVHLSSGAVFPSIPQHVCTPDTAAVLALMRKRRPCLSLLGNKQYNLLTSALPVDPLGSSLDIGSHIHPQGSSSQQHAYPRLKPGCCS